MRQQFDNNFIGNIVDATVDAIIAINSKGNIEIFNTAAENIFGYKREEVLGADVALLMHTEHAKKHSSYMDNYIKNGQSKIIHSGPRELVGRRKNGESFHMDLALNEMKFGDENYFVAIIRDITDRQETQSRLTHALSELTKFRKALDESSDSIFLIHYPSSNIVDVNNTAMNMLGYSRDKLLSFTLNDVFPTLGKNSIDHFFLKTSSKVAEHVTIVTELKNKEGKNIPAEVCMSAIPDNADSVIVATARDITERLKYERELENSKKLLLEAQNVGQFGSWEWDLLNDRLIWSDEVFRFFGLDRDKYVPTQSNFLKMISPEYSAQVIEGLKRAISGGERFSQEFAVITADKSQRIIHLQSKVYNDEHDHPTRMIGTIQDVTERKRAERELEYLSNYDVLTGLPNRKLFMDRFEHALGVANRMNYKLALIFIDLDHFKKVNDTLGHHVGDEMLKVVAHRIQSVLRQADTVARLGGDEFVIILENLEDMDAAAVVAEKIIKEITCPLVVEGFELFPGASLGISIYPDDSDSIAELLKYSDMAMYSAKESGRNSFQYYSPELNTLAQRHLAIEKNLRHALGNNEFYLVYQPQICAKTNQIVGVEALLRWGQNGNNFLSPVEFIPLLEESGLIQEVGDWVIRTAVNQVKAWQCEGLPKLRMSINISSKQFTRPDFLRSVQVCVSEADISPGELNFEITETALMDNVQHAINVMMGLKELGIDLSIDDFGKGYSSLGYLKKFPISTLKIDKSFISDLGMGMNGEAIIEAIIAMSKALGLKTIAEGVETVAQRDYLNKRGCDEVQGFLYSKPVTANDISQLFNQCEIISDCSC
jgi:diguanylate cyclase (GGDEF)-like protein/PAS domain S-box-containing protein